MKKFLEKKTGVPARFLFVGASHCQYEPFAIFSASFSIKLNEVGTPI